MKGKSVFKSVIVFIVAVTMIFTFPAASFAGSETGGDQGQAAAVQGSETQTTDPTTGSTGDQSKVQGEQQDENVQGKEETTKGPAAEESTESSGELQSSAAKSGKAAGAKSAAASSADKTNNDVDVSVVYKNTSGDTISGQATKTITLSEDETVTIESDSRFAKTISGYAYKKATGVVGWSNLTITKIRNNGGTLQYYVLYGDDDRWGGYYDAASTTVTLKYSTVSGTFDHIDLGTTGSFTFEMDNVKYTVKLNFKAGTMKVTYVDSDGNTQSAASGSASLSNFVITQIATDGSKTNLSNQGKWQSGGQDGTGQEYRISGKYQRAYTYNIAYTLPLTINGESINLEFSRDLTWADDVYNKCPGSGSQRGIDYNLAGDDIGQYFSKGMIKITKEFKGLDKSSEVPADTSFLISGPNGYSKTVKFSEFTISSDGFSGNEVISNLEPGTYTITETGKSVDEYSGPDAAANGKSGKTTTVTVKSKTTSTAAFVNTYTAKQKYGKIKLKKRGWEYNSSSNKYSAPPLGGATFAVYATKADAEAQTNALETATTAQSGEADFTKADTYAVGSTYYVRETSAPSGYIGSDKVYTIEIANTGMNTDIQYGGHAVDYAYNVPSNSITVNKEWSDSDTHDAIKIQLYRNGTAYGEAKTLAAGAASVTWNDLPEVSEDGNTAYTYTAKDVDVPAGYTSSGTATKANDYTITNTAIPPVTATIKAAKKLTGTPLTNQVFAFTLTDKDGSAESLAYADGMATIAKTYTYKDIGKTYTYTLAEKDLGAAGYTYDTAKYVVKVSITDADNDSRPDTPTVKYYKADGTTEISPCKVVFNNTYKTEGTGSIVLKKSLTGKDLAANMFSFKLQEIKSLADTTAVAGSDPVTVQNDADGNVTFDLAYSGTAAAGTHYYKVTEAIPQDAVNNVKDGTKYDATPIYVTVDVADNGGGVLTAETTYPKDKTFNNTYTAKPAKITLGAKKSLDSTLDLTQGQFGFELKETTAGAAYSDTAKNTAAGGVTFDELTFDKTGTYTYEISEAIPETAAKGYTYDTTKYTVTVVVTDDEAGQLHAAATMNGETFKAENAVFNNKYKADPTSIKLEGSKTLTGRDQIAGEFGFTVTEGTGNDAKTVATGTNKADGAIDFTKIEYDTAGEHTYTVTENQGTAGGIEYDTASYTVKVFVKDDGGGQLKATAEYPEGGVAFENSYTTKPGTFTPGAAKKLEGRNLTDENVPTFNFTLTETTAGAAYTDTAANTGSTVQFDTITYTTKGTHTYEITEDQGSAAGYTYSDTKYTVTVKVTDDNEGNLVVTATMDGKAFAPANAEFTNKYEPKGTSLTLNGSKTLTGRDQKAGEFTFTATEGSGTAAKTVATGKNNADGTIDFTKIEYTKADVGTHTYTVSENSGTAGGVAYDTNSYTVTVKVEDDGTGQLTATPTYPDNAEELTFNNEYTATGSIDLSVYKELLGKDLKADMFKFKMTEVSGADQPAARTAGNDGSSAMYALNGEKSTDTGYGKATFDPLTFNQDDIGKDFTYLITETKDISHNKNLKYSEAEYYVTIHVADNGDGTLDAAVTSVNGEKASNTDSCIFTNEYPTDVKSAAKIDVSKELTSEYSQDKSQFSINVTGDKDGMNKDITFTKDGKAEFNTPGYTDADAGNTYTYKITENDNKKAGYTYDNTTYYAVVEVYMDTNEDSDTYEYVQSKVTYYKDSVAEANIVDGITFNNTYKPDPAEYELTAQKYVENGTIKDGAYTFTAQEMIDKEPAGNALTAKNDANGKASFGKLKFDKAGVYEYVVTEEEGSDPYCKYSTEKYYVYITVEDDDSGKLQIKNAAYETTSDIRYENKEECSFTNEYPAGELSVATVDLTAEKTLKNGTLEDGQFEFTLGDRDSGKAIETVKNDASGNVAFTQLAYSYSDIGKTFNYVIKEKAGSDDSITYDETEYNVKVEIKTADSGKAYADVTKTKVINETETALGSGDAITFVNTYEKAAGTESTTGTTAGTTTGTTTSTKTSGTKTGDDSNMNLWMLLAALGLAGAILPVATRKKKGSADK
ncbi:MAG: FctA domain-containing protein [Eubacteriaceae bacterium]|nr:FctA domain-containing protein [Eubacteriaceae bacterium]